MKVNLVIKFGFSLALAKQNKTKLWYPIYAHGYHLSLELGSVSFASYDLSYKATQLSFVKI